MFRINDVTVAKTTENFEIYGVLYNWPASLVAAPAGWHVASDEEWKQLKSFLGMTESEINNSSRFVSWSLVSPAHW